MLGLDKFGIFAFRLGSRRRFQHGLSVTLGSQLRYHNKSEYRWCQKCDTDLCGTILPCTYCKMQPILLNANGLNFGQKIIFIRKNGSANAILRIILGFCFSLHILSSRNFNIFVSAAIHISKQNTFFLVIMHNWQRFQLKCIIPFYFLKYLFDPVKNES